MRANSTITYCIVLVLAACDGEAGGGDDDAGSSGGMDAAGTDGGTPTGDGGTAGDGAPGDAGPFSVDDAGFVLCGTERCACSNGVDDDMDGTVDGFDSECTGPLDDDEDSFATGIPGDNRDPDCQDCFFDGNSGSGDDGCRYATSCLTDGTPTSGSGSCATCEVTERCLESCRPRTPNGCDCFGCCEVHLDGGDVVYITIGGMCSIEMIDDTTACPRCMQDDDCTNDCGECELCLGRTAEDLPASCFETPDGGTPDGGMPPGYTCDSGETVCGPGLPECPSGYYCNLGCCLPILI